MGKYPDGPVTCTEDPSCYVLIKSLKNWAPILVFAFWVYSFLIIVTFLIYRKVYTLQKSPKSVIYKEGLIVNGSRDFDGSKNSPYTNEDIRFDMDNLRDLYAVGYTHTAFGEFCYVLCCLISLHWIALFILIFFDTYNQCEVGSIDNLCFYGNHVIFGSYDFNAMVFFVIWWLAAIWFLGWVINRGRVRNWFRMPCTLSEAHVINVCALEQREVLSVNVLFIIKLFRRIQRRIIPPESRGFSETVSVTKTSQGLHFFLFRGERYLIKGNGIHKASIPFGNTYADIHQCESGLSQEEAEQRFAIIGKNEIPFQPDPLLKTACAELSSLFHVYQLIMYLSWFWNSYLFVASLMAVIVCLSAAVTIYTKHKSQVAIAELTRHVTQVDVYRNENWSKIDSRDVVPGDIVKVSDDWLLPCDLIIIRGSCICDESSLTGEAAPVQKYQAPNNTGTYEPEGHGSRHTLFSGTRVLQAGTHQDHDVLAFVTATGMSTSKGKLLAAILYPEQMVFKYDEELPVVVILLLIYALVCFSIALLFLNLTGSETFWVTRWIYCLAIINQVMSPLLPVALEVGQLQAVERLKKRGIFTLNPSRIAIAGKIRIFCFDKTGTLTKEGLDFVGVQGLERQDATLFGPVKVVSKGVEADTLIIHGLATCHAVSKYGTRYVGNEVEVKMFQAVGWQLIEGFNEPDIVFDGNSEKLKIVKRYEFDHTRATMSVVVQDSQGSFFVYCKGSFEKLEQLCSERSLPKDYLKVAQRHALNGCYVLSLGYRSLDSGLTAEEILEMPRDELEMHLEFVSLILFRNEPKADSPAAIEALKEGEVRAVMVTGDNAQCGHYIARKCSMVAPQVQIFLGDVDAAGSVFWMPMDGQSDDVPEALNTSKFFHQYQKDLACGLVELAITGKAFNILRTSEWMERLIFSVRIFARFRPEDKVSITKMYRDHGIIVGMCGDGGNDCGALRTAHAGIALSEAEASVVSPFTSKDKSILSSVDLLKEGRGALHTSFACYKFLIMYGLMFSVFKLICYWYGVIVCQMSYVFIDGVAVLTLGYAMTTSHPEHVLGKVRPTSSLLGLLNVASVFGVWFINLMFLIGAICFMERQPQYVRWPARYSHGADWWTLGDNWESTVLFFTMYFQFITSAFIFTFGSSFRKSVFYNWIIMVCYGSLMVLMSVLLLLPPNGFTSLWHVASEQFNSANTSSPVWKLYQDAGGSPSPGMSFQFRLQLWLLILGGLATITIWQKMFAEGAVARYLARKFPSMRPKFHI
ncbi:hypothetical protein KP509_14G060200 [Ceratopteris richardii]|uniref:P-type ATPase A domain-containing protein n=1 Tax=Ceratopteris richardii TaxID=49495 RepID=A0A8T2T8E8_CERRI|nr:hypothetical protein KP509_14G060200 [Ceratopteris richardii]KAH7415780.1 hypothetical protein KP509_14G060200 [Ceratopteris richardii]KAH7415781.1 hypothetical protein KP509_14G060200 [Ceratopteris richardii]